MKKVISTILVLAAAQALMVALWHHVEQDRQPAKSPKEAESSEAEPRVAKIRTLPMNRPAPELVVQRADGTPLPLAALRGEPLVLHIWATWCPPCREELPSLLAYGQADELLVLAVSVDADWQSVLQFTGPEPGSSVALADAEAIEVALDVTSLPVTFVVDRGGVIRLRLDGARDWASPTLRSVVRRAVATTP